MKWKNFDDDGLLLVKIFKIEYIIIYIEVIINNNSKYIRYIVVRLKYNIIQYHLGYRVSGNEYTAYSNYEVHIYYDLSLCILYNYILYL